MRIKFSEGSEGVDIIDPIERHHERIITQDQVVLEHAKWRWEQYPVDSAIKITTDSFALPNTGTLNIRNIDEKLISEVGPSEDEHLSNGVYIFEASKSVKLYIDVRSEVYVKSRRSTKYIDLENESNVTIGARSYHTKPAGTIVTTSAPTDVMQAVSAFGSALKTAKPERSYPTLRGHPPLLKLGSELDIPAEFDQLNPPVQIEIPPTLEYVYVVSPLAYYLGAEVIPGSEPRLTTENGYSVDLTRFSDFESAIESVLRHIFFLDCVVRTEESSPGPVYERQVIESDLEFDISEVYNQSPSERIESYFEISFSAIESYSPMWNPKTIIAPHDKNVEFLPYLAKSLSAISIEEQNSKLPETTEKSPNLGLSSTEPVIQQRWDRDGDSKIKSTAPLTAFYNSIDRNPKKEHLDIEVICNSSSMSEELVTAYSAYGDRDELPFNVAIHHDLTTSELNSVLKKGSDFTHYIGHIDKNGFRCQDGNLNALSLQEVKTKLFFLNACHSHDQGLGLIKAGSMGGIVTTDEIQNDHAVNIGNTIARLLSLGYPLYAAVDIARVESTAGEQYHIVGDGSTSISQSKTIVPNSCSIIQKGEHPHIKINLYTSCESRKGCIFTPSIKSIPNYHLVPQNIGPDIVTKAELIKFLDINPIPVIVDGSMYWSDSLGMGDI